MFFLRGFLPLASSKQCPWSWMSMVPAHCSPEICRQLESRDPQTDVHSSDTAAAESHNPAWRTSLQARWYQCLLPFSADGPVDLLWMSSLPLTCILTPQMVISLFVSWVGLTSDLIPSTSWTQSGCVFVPATFIAATGERETIWDHRQGVACSGQVR